MNLTDGKALAAKGTAVAKTHPVFCAFLRPAVCLAFGCSQLNSEIQK